MTRLRFSPTPAAETAEASAVQSPRSRHTRLVAWMEHLLLLVLIAGFAVTGFLPAWRHLNSDFPNYYLVARLYRAGYPLDRVYEWTQLQRPKDYQGIDQGLVSFIPLTFPSALAVAPWSSLPPLQAKHRWLLANLVFLLLIAFLLVRMTAFGWERVGVLMFLAFIPLRTSFLLGQMHILVLLFLTVAAWLYFRGSPYLAGLSLAAGAALKIYPALFLLFFVWKKQWRAAIGLVVGLLSAAAISLYLFGKRACLVYVREVLPAALRGETLDPYNTGWNSITALFRRLFIAEPELNPHPVAHLPWVYALLQPLSHAFILIVFLWAIGCEKGDSSKTKIDWATYLFLLLFLSSQPLSYHFIALILTIVLVADELLAHQQKMLCGCAVLIYAMICGPLLHWPGVLPTGWQNLLFFPRLVLMTLLGGMLLWLYVRPFAGSLRANFSFRNLAIAGTALALLVLAGFIATQKHFRGQFDNYQARVVTTPGALFAATPAVTTDGVWFTVMTQAGYTIHRAQSGARRDFSSSEGDWFHPTVAETGSGWAEQASRNGSRVVRFPTVASGQYAAGVTPEIENAEEPAVSRDGQLLAFLRPVDGRNALWLRPAGATAGGTAAEREIAGADYEVREASFFPDHRLVFSSGRTGRLALYVATESGKVEELKRPTCPARYPAVSPDGRWLAFSCEHGGNWQLHAIDLQGNVDLQGNQEIQLSPAECNSISPAWRADSKRLVYATDCGRGLGLTALAETTVIP